jgi:hypothetical protein
MEELMISLIAATTAILGNYVPLLGPSGWLLTMIMGTYCALGLLDGAAQPLQYARMLGKFSIDAKKQEGYRKRKRWSALALLSGALLAAMSYPYLDLIALMLLSFVLARIATAAYCQNKLTSIGLIASASTGTIVGILLSIAGWSIQALPRLTELRPSFAMGTTTNWLALVTELAAYLFPCFLVWVWIVLTRPKTLDKLELKYGPVGSS